MAPPKSFNRPSDYMLVRMNPGEHFVVSRERVHCDPFGSGFFQSPERSRREHMANLQLPTIKEGDATNNPTPAAEPSPNPNSLPKRELRSKARASSKLNQHTTSSMTPEKISIAAPEIRSEPTTPVYATHNIPAEATASWFAPVSHKEKLAMLTMEQLPEILLAQGKREAASSPTKNFSPTLFPMLERMKFYYARSMALARYESEHGYWNWNEKEKDATSTTDAAKSESAGGNKNDEKPDPVQSDDVMSSLEVERFLAGIEEVRIPPPPPSPAFTAATDTSIETNNASTPTALVALSSRVIYRRYWRILAPPGMTKEAYADPKNTKMKFGGVVGSGSTLDHHVRNGLNANVRREWDGLPKVLVGEFRVGRDGIAVEGRILAKVGDEVVFE